MSAVSFDHKLSELSFVAFDTETTGLSASQERVVEVSAVRFGFDGEEVGTFDELVDPGKPIPPGAARVHGIDDSMVKGQPTTGDILPAFFEFCEDAVLLAHNADFDLSFIVHEASRYDVPLPFPPVIDTVDVSRRLRPDLPNHKLATISKALGCEASTYHRALADAQTLARTFLRLVGEPYVGKTLGDLAGDIGCLMSFGSPGRMRLWLPPHLSAIDQAMESGGKVTIVYTPEGKRQDAKDVQPVGYIRRPGATYLLGRGDDGNDRSFRVDWITRAHLAQATLF